MYLPVTLTIIAIKSPFTAEDEFRRDSINITCNDTLKGLRFCSSSAADPDGIPRNVIRDLAPALAIPVSIIFQQSEIRSFSIQKEISNRNTYLQR